MGSIFLFISSSLVIIGGFTYLVAIWQGRAKPHRTTRFVLLIIVSLSATSLVAQGNYIGAWLPGTSVIFSILFFVLSLKFGMGGWEKADLLCLLIALIGIILWRATSNPILALYFSIGADFTGIFPTIIKTYRFPQTESLMFFLLNGLAGFFNFLATKEWLIQNYAYSLYISLICLILVLLILRPRFMSEGSSRAN